ncbi:MAG TPA: acylneuraminate cytidylyltransferase family protein [Cytophagaceae bacterium]|jgi:CMP-N-acetylneuraminic acid synthetase|nr:acylneuraminate cytidylyltransferase family protein [Cytophagaceae bacterium]
MKVTAFIPIKEHSERLHRKNFLDFCGQPLYEIILDKLQEIVEVEKIVINTDSTTISEKCAKRYDKVHIIERPLHLRKNEITANAFIEHDLELVSGEHFLQTHCTNPLLSKQTIVKAIRSYFDHLHTYDSLLTVSSIRKRAYYDNGMPINHSNFKLEQTQDLPEVHIENSNIFLFSRTSFFNNSKSRVGKSIQLFPMNAIEGMDIDYPEDFHLAELIYKNKTIFAGLN